ncbi:MAG: sigma-54-dependent Fis family transcriptional regulator [Puniceicoccaceae bacterium]|nr:MAG: sigma-54-dependent Fis family transcriptional regulator [Puniceicoccaceae bacterium]
MTAAPSQPSAPVEAFRLLIVEDDPLLGKRLQAYCRSQGFAPTLARSLAEARRELGGSVFDGLLLDLNLPDGHGLDLLRDSTLLQSLPTVVMTGEGGIAVAVEAMKAGAADFLAKPFDLDQLPIVLERVHETERLRRSEAFTRSTQSRQGASLFFGDGLAGIRARLDKILAADRSLGEALPPVLIEGETGTGKTTIARWLHHEGPRASGPLIEVNCSALPENLAESELFGHEKGAFTDARSVRIGLFEAAEGGTLFLDEIASLPLPVQAKVLDAVEDRRIRRLGGNRPRPVNFRLIAAANVDLRAEATEGRFRGDLYQRLDLLRIQLPPLRERRNDLLPLAERLAAALFRKYGQKKRPFSAAARRKLLSHPWPGNIRELAHELERSIIFEDAPELTLENLADPASDQPDQQLPFPDWLAPDFQLPQAGFSLERAIRQLIELALRESSGNVSKAARRLGVSRDYLRYRLENRPRKNGE